MKPTLLEFTLPVVGEVTFPSYLTLLLAGFLTAIWLARREEDRRGGAGERIVDLGLLMLICGVMGARLLSVLADGHLTDFVNLCVDPTKVPPADAWARTIVCAADAQCAPHYLCDEATRACHPPRDCLQAFKFWYPGLTYYGGFLLAVPVGLWYARRKRLGMWRVADLTAPVIALGLAFGRVGCFLNGCCYGRATDLPWAARFPGIPGHVHPTQLYESLGALAIFAILYLGVRPRKRAHGQVLAALLVLYGVLRFLLELIRADERGQYGPLSTSQWISIPLVLVGLWLFWARARGRLAEPPHRGGATGA